MVGKAHIVKNGVFAGVLISFLLMGCLRQDDWESPTFYCNPANSANATLEAIFELYDGSTTEIFEDLVVEAYIISSDEAGNFFNTLHLQDKPSGPSAGIEIELELRDSYLHFSPGEKVFIHAKGLYLGRAQGRFRLGSAYSSFGNLIPGRIPKHAIPDFLLKTCTEPEQLIPNTTTIDLLPFQKPNTLIRLEDVEFREDELGLPFASGQEETLRTLIDCEDREVLLLNSGYSDFYDQPLPDGRGTLDAVYYPDRDKGQLIIRSLSDLNLNGERCEDLITEFSSEHLFISEIADPENSSGARFIELFYSGDEPLSLKGWHLDRYTNDNPEPGSSIDLSAFTINQGELIVLASNAVIFEQTYGFPPDLEAGTNSPADSNGDDNLVLVDPFGKVVDIFGVVGEDGSGTDHEFEDGRALRKTAVNKGNSVYTFSEWTIYNDTGAAGTFNEPQNAPQDFTPGTRN
jgi:hypothetical protein